MAAYRRRSMMAAGLPPKPLLLVLAAAWVGCASPGRPLELEPRQLPPMTEEDYPLQLERWTRSDVITVIEKLTTTMRVHATLRSPEFDAAYVAKRQEMFSLPPPQVQQLRADLAKAWREHYTFVLVVATHDRKWNDLHQRNSQWRLWLINDRDQQVEAAQITSKRRIDMVDRAFFPKLEPFYHLYEVTFPRQLPDGRALIDAASRSLTLRISGALGVADLVWQIRDSSVR